MRNKSKFIAFILSGVPGLAHLYIGLKERAIIFSMMFCGILFGSIGLSVLTHRGDPMIISALGYPILWLVALIDMFSAWKNLEKRELYNEETFNDTKFDEKFNKKTVAMALSVVPGAGHMFLGYQKKGLLLMGIFFFSVFFMGWLGISLFLFTLPLIWFYSFFDTMHIVDGNNEVVEDKEFILPSIKPEWIGYGLIGIGVFIILERILLPLIDYQIRRYIQTSIVSLIFIVVGLRMLRKNRKNENIEVSRGDNDED